MPLVSFHTPPPENIRKPVGIKRDKWYHMGYRHTLGSKTISGN